MVELIAMKKRGGRTDDTPDIPRSVIKGGHFRALNTNFQRSVTLERVINWIGTWVGYANSAMRSGAALVWKVRPAPTEDFRRLK